MITINDKYRIDIDRYNYTLQEKSKSKNKKTNEITEKWVDIGYYMNLEECLKGAWRKHKRTMSKEYNLEEYLEKLSKLEEKFVRDIRKAMKEG